MGSSRYNSDSDSDNGHRKKKKSKRSSRRSSRSRDNSRDRTSRRKYRSRSYDRKHRRRSRSRGRRRSYSRSYSRERGRRRRSQSRNRSYSRSRNPDKRYERSRSRSITRSFADMNDEERKKAIMQLAIEKAKAADEAIRQRHGVTDLDTADTQERREAINRIDDENFTQISFKSSRSQQKSKQGSVEKLEFGTSLQFKIKPERSDDKHYLMADELFEDIEVKKKRWYTKLCQLQEEVLRS